MKCDGCGIQSDSILCPICASTDRHAKTAGKISTVQELSEAMRKIAVISHMGRAGWRWDGHKFIYGDKVTVTFETAVAHWETDQTPPPF